MSTTKELTKKESSVPAQAAKPEGFDGFAAEDFAAPMIKLWAKMTKAEVEGGKLGQWYEVNSSKAVGESLTFNLLAVKTMKYEREDKKTGMVKINNVKHLLVWTGGPLPKILAITATSFGSLRKLMTMAYEKAVTDNFPLYAYKITATSEVTSNDAGEYAVANFTLGQADKENLAKLAEVYAQFGKTFGAEKEVSAESFGDAV